MQVSLATLREFAAQQLDRISQFVQKSGLGADPHDSRMPPPRSCDALVDLRVRAVLLLRERQSSVAARLVMTDLVRARRQRIAKYTKLVKAANVQLD